MQQQDIRKSLKRSKKTNLLFCCDNDDCMNYLLQHGLKNNIDLVYIDPPFHSGERYFHRNDNRSQIAFEDIWKDHDYLAMMRSRLSNIWQLLSPTGSIFVHLDWHALHYIKIMMDEIFGPDNFRNEIVVKRGRRKNLQYQFKSLDRMHNAFDSILWYSKSKDAKFSLPLVEHHSESKWMGFWSNVNRPTMRYKIFGYAPERGQWKWSKERALRAIANYSLFEKEFSSNMSLEHYWVLSGRRLEFIRKRDNVKYAEYWIPSKTHKILDNIWFDIEAYNYSTGYATEKHEQLLERIISLFSKPGDTVADLFCGSGTTLIVAQRLGRHWIGCDSSTAAISVVQRRLQKVKFKVMKIK
jgi:adenine specific DNA methylase Mod